MRTSIMQILTFIILVSSCINKSDKNAEKFILEGEIEGKSTGQVVLRYLPSGSELILDTVELIEGKFIFTGEIFEPTKALLMEGNSNDLTIYLESGTMGIKLKKERFSDYKMTGSKTQNELIHLQGMEKPFNEQLTILRNNRTNYNDSIKNANSTENKLLIENKLREINNDIIKLTNSRDSIYLKFITENPKSYISSDYLASLEFGERISLETLKLIFNGLDRSIQDSHYGVYIKEDIRKKENIQIGSIAPDFKAPDINNQIVTLSQFKGKVILLDFWASWCIPCRNQIPYLKSLYKKYNPLGFEIIAVTIDWDRVKWRSAVEMDSTELWTQIPFVENYPFNLRDPAQISDYDVYKNYFVLSVPLQILISQDGIVVGRWGGGFKDSEESLESKLDQLLEK